MSLYFYAFVTCASHLTIVKLGPIDWCFLNHCSSANDVFILIKNCDPFEAFEELYELLYFVGHVANKIAFGIVVVNSYWCVCPIYIMYIFDSSLYWAECLI